tara:strand:- start:11020 stop:11280 length:261 start_codon:yes stop_codon:yes gene_type:complete
MNEDNLDFHESIKLKEEIGQELGETRKWRSFYTNDYSPHGMKLVKMTREHIIETVYHCFNTIEVLKEDLNTVETKLQQVTDNSDTQ